jgi:hypothetical protein
MPLSDSEARRAIQKALAEVRVVDPHCHLAPQRPTARNLADIVLYHHVWIEMVSAGMGQRETNATGMPHELEDPGIPPGERVHRALPWLPRIRNTTVAMMLRWILEDVYDFHETLGAANAERLAKVVADRAGDTGWEERLFTEVCGIERSISVQTLDPGINPRIMAASEALGKVNLADGKRTPREVLSDMDARLGREVRTAADYCAALDKILASLPIASLQFLGAWVSPAFAPDFANETDVTRIIRLARDGTPTSALEMGSVAWFGLVHCMERLRATPLRTIQVILGAEVLLPHRSLTQWGGGFAMSFGRFAGLFEDFHFNMSTAAEAHVQDLAILAKHVPNISVAGYWWHTFYPSLIRKSLETRLEMVPLGKIIGFFSDAYHAEWCHPKLKLVKTILGDILSDRVSRGWYTLDDALAVIQTILHDAPKRIYATG